MKEKIEEYAGCLVVIVIAIIGGTFWVISPLNENKIAKAQRELERNFLLSGVKIYAADTSFDSENGKMLYRYQEKIMNNHKITLHRFSIKNITRIDSDYLIDCQKTFPISEDDDFYMKFNLRCGKQQLHYLTYGLSETDVEEKYLNGYNGCIVANIDSVYRNSDTIVCIGNIVGVINGKISNYE